MQNATAHSNPTVAECLAMGSHLQRLACSVNHLYCREKYRPHHAYATQCCEEIIGSGSFVPPSEWELFAREFRGIATLIVGDSSLENKAQFLRALGVNNSCEGGGGVCLIGANDPAHQTEPCSTRLKRYQAKHVRNMPGDASKPLTRRDFDVVVFNHGLWQLFHNNKAWGTGQGERNGLAAHLRDAHNCTATIEGFLSPCSRWFKMPPLYPPCRHRPMATPARQTQRLRTLPHIPEDSVLPRAARCHKV